jgi:hypothetical protein
VTLTIVAPLVRPVASPVIVPRAVVVISVEPESVTALVAKSITSPPAPAVKSAETIVSFNDEDDNYIIIDNGTDTGIFLFVDNQIAAIAAAELTLIAALQGVDDSTDLTAANFVFDSAKLAAVRSVESSTP